MRIGLNLLYLVPGEVGGTEVYARELIGELARLRSEDEFIVYCNSSATASLAAEGWPGNVQLREQPVGGRNKPSRVGYEMLRLPGVARRNRLDLLHSLGVTSPLWGRTPRVVSIHDLIFHHYPGTFPFAAQRGLEFLVPRGARRARRVITISQASADDLSATFGIDAAKIDVTHLGSGWEPGAAVDEATLREELALGDDAYALCVASGHEHKNIPRLLDAFAQVSAPRTLVVCGHAGLDQEKLIAQAASLGIADRVHFTGWVSREKLEGLYAAAELFVYPTLIEGFGIPVLEAMARGVPVACSDTSSLPEVAGDAAEMFDPQDVDAIAAAIEWLAGDADLRAQLIADGLARAERFTWRACAEATWASYERALAG